MNIITRHVYKVTPGISRLDGELSQYRTQRMRTMRQEYDLLAAIKSPTPAERARREQLRVTLGITSPKEIS